VFSAPSFSAMGDLAFHCHERPYKIKKYKSERRENGEEQGRSLKCYAFSLLTMP